MNEKQKELKALLTEFVGEGKEKKFDVDEESADMLLTSAISDGIEQEMIDYIKENTGISFWKLLELLKPGIGEDVDMDSLT